MIALYLSWNPINKSIEIDAGSPTSRNAIQESPELQNRISEAMINVWKELGSLPYLPTRTTDKGVSLIPPRGTWNMTIAVYKFQRELGEDFNISERPIA